MVPQSIDIQDYLESSKDWIVIDVRSQKEFQKAHIPGALNIPLLDDDSRHLVGVAYKEQGRAEAVHLGLKLIGPKMDDLLREFERVYNPDKKILFYCWRGGLRSGISSSLFAWAGYKTQLVSGGYKAYRNWVLSQFEQTYKVRILGGATGSGKTEILHHMRSKGAQIIDLEGIANHKGSAFGGIGQEPQPTTEAFENQLAHKLSVLDGHSIIWFENESHLIGTCFIPQKLWEQMSQAPILKLNVDKNTRVQRLSKEYGHFDKEILIEKTRILRRKLGGQNEQFAIDSITQGDTTSWLETLLVYYDKTYGYGTEKNKDRITELDFDWSKQETEIDKILQHELNK